MVLISVIIAKHIRNCIDRLLQLGPCKLISLYPHLHDAIEFFTWKQYYGRNNFTGANNIPHRTYSIRLKHDLCFGFCQEYFLNTLIPTGYRRHEHMIYNFFCFKVESLWLWCEYRNVVFLRTQRWCSAPCASSRISHFIS